MRLPSEVHLFEAVARQRVRDAIHEERRDERVAAVLIFFIVACVFAIYALVMF